MADFRIQDVHPSLRHPTDPIRFKVSEGEYVTAEYVTKVCTQVACTFSLWSETEERYIPVPPIIYEGLTREAAFTRVIYALNTRDPSVNRWGQRYSNVRTREITL